MSEWSEKVQLLKDEHKGNPWSPYAPQSKRGFNSLAKNENLACVFCVDLVGVKSEEIPEVDGSIVIACDHDINGGWYKRVTLIPDEKVDGGAEIASNSQYGCSRGLLRRKEM